MFYGFIIVSLGVILLLLGALNSEKKISYRYAGLMILALGIWVAVAAILREGYAFRLFILWSFLSLVPIVMVSGVVLLLSLTKFSFAPILSKVGKILMAFFVPGLLVIVTLLLNYGTNFDFRTALTSTVIAEVVLALSVAIFHFFNKKKLALVIEIVLIGVMFVIAILIYYFCIQKFNVI